MNQNTQSKRRKWTWIVAGALALVLVFAGFTIFANNGERSAAADSADSNIVTAFIGDLSSAATATGQIEAQREAQLSLGVSGTVETVYVREGSEVRSGDVLVQLDTAALERAVANAEQNLIIQEANLVDLLNGASAADLASAQASVASAQANLENVQDGADQADIDAARASLSAAQAAYTEVLDGPDANSTAQAEANLRNAEATLKQAQASYDDVAWRSDIGRLPQALELEQATNSYEVALANYNSASESASDDQIQQSRANVVQAEATLEKLVDSPTAAELANAESQLAQAQAQLDGLLDSASAEKVAVAEAQVAQARINLEDARDNLDKATLTAPFAGVITTVYVAEGETAAGLAVDIIDTNSLEVVLNVDEVDIGELAVGQAAVITLETWPDVEITGEIASIAPKSTQGSSAIVSYEVRLSLDETELPVLVGMTANADLITAAKTNILLIPNEAITPDREAGRYYVNLVETGIEGEITTQKVEISIGLKHGDYTEVISGLQEGAQLSTITISAGTEEAANGFMPPRPEGGNSGGAFGR